MLRGISQRTAVAITLMGLLLSVGTCIIPAQRVVRSCCSHMSMPCDGTKANCCKVSPQAPPAAVTQVFPGFASMDAAEDFFPASGKSTPHPIVVATVLPPQSPPPGISILRI